LVGVEQTQDSARLDNFRFPPKTILLLGNEKEGIPVELIQVNTELEPILRFVNLQLKRLNAVFSNN
jgi:tRNA G18 (ribose-2'-O)-methylase SpoU